MFCWLHLTTNWLFLSFRNWIWFWSAWFHAFVIRNDRIHYSCVVHSIVKSYFSEGERRINTLIRQYDKYRIDENVSFWPYLTPNANSISSNQSISIQRSPLRNTQFGGGQSIKCIWRLNNANCLSTICSKTFSVLLVFCCCVNRNSTRDYCCDQKFCSKQIWMNHCWQWTFPHESQYPKANERICLILMGKNCLCNCFDCHDYPLVVRFIKYYMTEKESNNKLSVLVVVDGKLHRSVSEINIRTHKNSNETSSRVSIVNVNTHTCTKLVCTVHPWWQH